MIPRRARLVAGAALAVVAAGCGGATGGQTNSSSGASTQTTTTTKLPGNGRPPVTIGDKNTPEQFVLGELYYLALAARGFSVSINRNIGPTSVTVHALRQGSLGLYPEYIDVWNQSVAGDTRSFKSARAAYAAGQSYALRQGFELLKPTPFGDTSGLAVTDYYAGQHGLKTVADMGPMSSSLTVGGLPQFKSTQLAALERVYNLPPPTFKVLPVGGQYDALNTDAVQAAAVNTTDGSLATGDYRVLADPSHVLGWGNVVPVVTQKVLSAEGPAFAATVNAVSALLTLQTMRQLNELVDQHVDPVAVASQFLETHGLIPPPPGS